MRLMNEAHNVLSPEARASALRLKLVEKAEAHHPRVGASRWSASRASRSCTSTALAGGGSGMDGDGSGGSFADSVVNSALRFRAQAPIVDQLLREIGLESGDIQRLAGGVSAAPRRCRRRPRRRRRSEMAIAFGSSGGSKAAGGQASPLRLRLSWALRPVLRCSLREAAAMPPAPA